ncbi:hypothetical protein VM1G_01602 [Cytospora mali]|uniref:Uncharacterized protein n=1 Tax=Cytospora mali TaxID=578113 RepID=A0A194VQE8_CYTMA|nr:hypothetical protein VM1G_01602 [Valsa mali]
MKPLVGAMQAWSCFVISIFAIIILSILGLAFKHNHEEFVGGIEQPEDGPAVAHTIFIAVLVYIVSPMENITSPAPDDNNELIPVILQGFVVFCGLQGLLHMRESRRGAIAL